MTNETTGKWIIDRDFAGLTPLDLFHKENTAAPKSVHREDLKNRHMLVRKEFTLDKVEGNTRIFITADDYYKLYINAAYVGQGPAPSYHFHYNMNYYDISRFLRPGPNVIAVHVYYQGLLNRVWNSADYRMGMKAEIKSGDRVILASGGHWKYENAREFVGTRTIGYATQFTEDIDARNKIIGWKDLGFDDSEWPRAVVKEDHDYRFFPQPTPCLQVYRILPRELKEIPGGFRIDFGHEITGRLLASATGKAGDLVKLSFGEELESSGAVRGMTRCNCDYNETWILASGDNQLEQYDYKGFRYAEISSENAVIDVSSLCAEVRHYPFDEKALHFESSQGTLNKVWDICVNAVRYGTQEGFLDCPSREKGQYLGDATITALSHAYITGDYRMYKKCLSDFARSAIICPGLMATAPGSWMQEIADYSLQWPLQLLNYHRLSGDKDFLAETLPVLEAMLAHFKKFSRNDGLLANFNDKPIMVDWPSNLRDDYDSLLMPKYQDGANTVLNAFFIGAIQGFNRIKEILGLPIDKKEPENLKAAFIHAFFDKKTKLFVDMEGSKHSSLHANSLALFYGLVPDNANPVIDFIKTKRLSCGIYFAYFVLKALARAGEHDFILELLLCSEEHSWGNMVTEGATTCFEAWGKDQKWNTSLCHPWGSAPLIILIEDIVGLKMREPGWKKIAFEPKCEGAFDFLRLRIPSPLGMVSAEWDKAVWEYKTGAGSQGQTKPVL